jgi:hypothetical protein
MIDPTRWESPIFAWRYWLDAAERCEKAMYEIQEMYGREYGHSISTDIRIKQDPNFCEARGNWQMATTQTLVYGAAVQIRLLELILARLTDQPKYTSQ